MAILVTGSSGTIGTRLCESLLADGKDVIGCDWVPNKWQPAVQAVTRQMDLREPGAMDALPDGIDTVIHLAANARVYELVEDPARALDNFVTLFNALEFARKRGVKRFLFASSREGYGNIKADVYKEDMVRIDHCESPYTASKVGGEALVQAYRRCYELDAIIVRFSNVYGMYDDSIRVVPLFIRLARKNEPLTVFGKEKCLDFTWIDDAVHGVRCCLDRFEAAKNDVYNIAYGQGTTIVRLAERVKEIVGSSSEIRLGEPRTGEIVRYVADISKAKEKLGYDPQTPFDRGIEKAAAWYAANT